MTIHSDFTASLARRANAARNAHRADPEQRGNGRAYRTSTDTVLDMTDYVICPHFGCPLNVAGQPLQRRDFHQHVKECHR